MTVPSTTFTTLARRPRDGQGLQERAPGHDPAIRRHRFDDHHGRCGGDPPLKDLFGHTEQGRSR